jgi:hypothetical protein
VLLCAGLFVSGCASGPSPEETLDGAVTRAENAADFLAQALEDWSEAVAGRSSFGAVAEASSEVTPALESAADALARAEDSVEPLEATEATRRFSEGTSALADMMDRMGSTLADIAEASEVASAYADLSADDEGAWDNYEDFVSDLNDEEWDEALETAERAQDDWTALSDRVATLEDRWPSEGFDEVAAMMQRQVDLGEELIEQARLGQDLNRFSSSSVNAYNDQLDVIDAIEQEILEWELPDAYTDAWTLFDHFNEDFEYMDEKHREFRRAMQDVRALIQ